MLRMAAQVTFKEGDTICSEGSSGDSMFMLAEGCVGVEKSSVRLTSFSEPGDFFGEMVFVDVLPRSATLKADSVVRVLVFQLETLRSFFESYPSAHLAIVMNIARGLSKRLRDANQDIVDLKQQLEAD